MTVIMQSPPSRKELSHDRIVEAASRAIRRVGYHGVGVADMMREAGLTHGGFYAHFTSREALLIEALERAGRDNARSLGDRMAKLCATGMGHFAAFVNAYLHDDQLRNTERGCVVAALSSESARQDPAIQRAARARVQVLIERVQEHLPAKVDADEAPVIAATLVGALQLARTLDSKQGRALLATTRQSVLDRYDG